MTPPVEKILGCPACGMSVTGQEDACPRCGKKFDKYAKFECPFCGKLISEGSQRCPLCNVDLTGISSNVKIQSVEKTMDQLMTDLIEIESEQVKKEDKRFCCPECAWLLDGTEPKCPKCGQVLTGKLGLLCPICGIPVEKGLKECPRCGALFEKLSAEAKPMIPLATKPPEKPTGETVGEVPSDSQECLVCGTVSPIELLKCPRCGTSFDEGKTVDRQKEPTKAQDAEEALIALGEIEKLAGQPKRERKLKPKPEKVTRVAVTAQTGGRGLSNGIGQVNGRSKINGVGMVNGMSKINGTGAVNGKSLVNGTGISNGLRARPREGGARHAMFLTKWQFLAVLVAIAIILPTFVYLSYSKKAEEYAVDGKFGEWDDATTYGTRIQSTSSMTNITEWAVGSQSTDLFFYFRTESPMMNSSEPESFYLFVDSDGSNSTGYVVESIGADYMLQLTGWDNAVNSTSVSQYTSSSDQLNWNAWTSIGSLSFSMEGVRLEAGANMPVAVGQSAKFMLISKDSLDRSSISYAAPLKGGVLVVQQMPSDEVAADGLVPKSSSVSMLTVRFTCEGEGGRVEQVNPALTGTSLSSQIASFSLDKGQEHEINITVDTSLAMDGQLVSTKLLESSIVSSFASVDITGDGASAYVGSPPSAIEIDGAFADWNGRLTIDEDSIPVSNPDVDIDETGNVSTTDNSYFYVSVAGELCSGTVVPARVVRPSGSGGGGVVILPRHTAEDVLNIYIDSDKSNSTGQSITLNSMLIGADRKIEIKGLFGRITSSSEFSYSSGDWIPMLDVVEAAKDFKSIEISVTAASLGGSSAIDFIVETTTWKGLADMATYDPTAGRVFTRSWIVDSTTSSSSATALSCQRKLFYDGTNFWSFYFDGSNTVYKYSTDNGVTWTLVGAPFKTTGVDLASIWYDSANNIMYAVGDTSASSTSVSLQRGTVAPATHTITWESGQDKTLVVSQNPLGRKHTYISKDASGYIWVMSSNLTSTTPSYQYDLSVFRSSSTDSIASFVYSGNMLPATVTGYNVKGSILPAGSGSNMWAVYGYMGNVAARKYTGTWSAETVIYNIGNGNLANTYYAPPCALVDSSGVIHVVYGNGHEQPSISKPFIYYVYNTGSSWSVPYRLDSVSNTLGNFYPTISVDSSTGNVYAFWIQTNTAGVGITVMGKKNVTGTWVAIDLGSQTTDPKQYLNSIYSVSGETHVCWQWTQNTSAPIQVIFDKIPEFHDLALPVIFILTLVCASKAKSRRKNEKEP